MSMNCLNCLNCFAESGEVTAKRGLHKRQRYIEDERQNCGEALNCAALVKERKLEKRQFGCNFCDG